MTLLRKEREKLLISVTRGVLGAANKEGAAVLGKKKGRKALSFYFRI
jgi:hypothetical protein